MRSCPRVRGLEAFLNVWDINLCTNGLSLGKVARTFMHDVSTLPE